MNFVFLSPHFPPNFYLFPVGLARAGARVLGIGEASWEELRPELKEAMAEYYRVESMNDYDQVVRAMGYFIHHHGLMDRIESHNEHWLLLEGALREDFNIFGPKRQATQTIKRKSLMKDVFRKAGIPVVRGEVYQDAAHARKFAKAVGYPFFAKPDIGVGAASTYKISNERDLEEFIRSKPDCDYFMEEFIDGELFTFDGITNSNNEIVYYTSHYSAVGCYEAVAFNDDLWYYSLRNIPEKLRDYGFRSVKAFDIREKFFHFEFFRRKTDGEFIPLELNCRPPGGFTTDMMNFTSDIDVYQQWANVVVQGRFTADVERKYHCAHIARKFGKNYRYSHEQIIEMYADKLVMYSEVSPVLAQVMGNLAYLARTPEEKEIRQIVQDIQALA
ncbi:MAG TPA: carboxylate--amine ligase [Candidatus Ozemobacteraceae bacterium]